MGTFIFGIVSLIFVASAAHAESAGFLEEKVRALEQRVRQLESFTGNLDRRLRALEGGYGSPMPSPEPNIVHSAILIESSLSKTFLGTGSTKLQAEASARQACSHEVHQSSCEGPVRFGQSRVGSKGSFCVIQDELQGKTFSAEGPDEIYAEAKAKQACEKVVHSSYCGNAQAKCEAVQ